MATTNFQAFSGDVEVASNLQVGTANLFVDITTGQVGIGKTNPTQLLDIAGNVAANVNTLFVDTVTSRVGIGTSNPSAPLEVSGNVTVGSTLTVSGFRITAAAAATDDLESITTDDPGADPPKVDAGRTPNQIHITNATRAISSSTGALRVGDTGAPGGIGVVGNVYVGDTVTTQDLSVDNVISDFAVNTDDFFVDISESKVGVSTTQPHAELHVVGNVYVSSNLTVDADTLHVDAANDRVGVNTKNPEASLHLVGNAYVSGDLETDSDILMSSNVFIKGPGPTSNVVAIGIGAGYTTQGLDSVAIGTEAGKTEQGSHSVAIGLDAGKTSQGVRSVAVGFGAGITGQGISATTVGYNSGKYNQGNAAVAIGVGAGESNQVGNAVAIGNVAGTSSQGNAAVAIGNASARYNQGSAAVAIGQGAGCSTQVQYAVAIGYNAGYLTQGRRATAVGINAGGVNQACQCTALGDQAGMYNQKCYAVAVGLNAGHYNQGAASVAVGTNAALSNQGIDSIAIGTNAGYTNQPANSFYTRYASVRGLGGSYNDLFIGTTGEFLKNTSDDRLKHDEKFITGAVKSLSKLRPQEYLKRQKLDANVTPQQWTYEAGLMAQEVYYSAPELRHIVQIPPGAGDIDNYTPPPSDDPTQDPDYSMWGNDASTVAYNQLTPYLIKAVQEIVTELPRSKTTVSNTWGQNIMGLVVSANANAHKTNTAPIVTLSNVYMDKKWYGVVSDQKTDTNDYDTLVDTKGDTRIWVTDVGGPLESGDLLTTSNVSPGFAQKQGDGALMNYTVAKVTQDCDFTEPMQRAVKVPRLELSNVRYYRHDSSWGTTLEEYEEMIDSKKTTSEESMYFKEVANDSEHPYETRYYQGDTEVSEKKYNTLPEDDRTIKYLIEIDPDMYNGLDAEDKATYSPGIRKMYKVKEYSQSKTQLPQHDEEVFIEEMTDVLDENGQIVWEDTANTTPAYTLVDYGTYKAALVTCKLV
jgi:hypothetical protein